MATPLPITFRISPLTPGKKYTPQQFADAIAARLSIDTQEELSLFVSGSIAPTTDQGPWLANGTTWYVWDSATGAYVPQPLSFESLKYIASQTPPDQNIYTFWILLDSAGKAQGIYYYSTGAWRSVYDDSFLALQSEIAIKTQQYPFRGDSAADQTLTAAGDNAVVTFTETFDPTNVFGASTFTAPVAGYYQINTKVNMEASGGAPTANTVIVKLIKNGSTSGIENEFATCPIIDGDLGQHTYNINTMLSLAANDTIQVYVECSATGAGNWVIKESGTYFSGHRVTT